MTLGITPALLGVTSFPVGEVVPAVVQNADVWLDAADASTITESGGAVSQWDNKGSLGNFTQGTAALQPTTGVSTLNGLNVINFAGDYLGSADAASTYKFMHDGTDYIFAAVWKAGTTANPNARYTLLGTSTGSAGEHGVIISYDDRSGSHSDAFRLAISNGTATYAVTISEQDVLTPNAFEIITGLIDPDNGTAANRALLYVDNGSAIDSNTNTATPSASNPTYTLYIGAVGTGEIPLTGSIAELVIVSGADATESNRQIIRNYLNAKWDVY